MTFSIDCDCGEKFTVSETDSGKAVPCPKCGKPVAVINPAVTLPGSAQQIAQWLNQAKPKEVEQLSEAIQQIQSGQRTTRLPWLALVLLLPIVIIFDFLAIVSIMAGKLPVMVAAFLIAAPATVVLFNKMRGKWTVNRAVVALCLFAFWLNITIGVGLDSRRVETFSPVQNEFAAFVPSGNLQPSRLKLKMFPLFIGRRGEKSPLAKRELRLPSGPAEMDIYNKLPDFLRAQTPAEAGTVVILEWGWQECPGGFLGSCTLNVIDRQTQRIIATTKLIGADKAPPANASTPWYGKQPTHEDVTDYLKQVCKDNGTFAEKE